MIKLNESESIPYKTVLNDFDNANRSFSLVSLGEIPAYGGPHKGFAISWKATGLNDVASTRKFIAELERALKVVDRLDKKYKGKTIDY